jgi:hypothetical protein
MANPNTPYGLRPYSYVWGSPYAGAVRVYAVPANNGTALYLGDPVKLITNSSDGNGVQNVVIGTAGGGAYNLGAFMGIANNAGSTVITLQQTQTPYLAASQQAYVYVCDDPNVLFAIQENGSGGAMVSGASGRNADLVSGSGSTVTSQSGWQLASNTLNTTNTLQMRIIQALQEIDNTVAILSAKWLVKFNLHSMNNLLGV